MHAIRSAFDHLAACAALLALSTTGVHAAGMSPDPTGQWVREGEPGWGMTVTQQGDVLFALIFIYDAARRPAWYVASDVAARNEIDPASGSPIFGGTLYRTSGPPFGTPFDPASVAVSPVGELRMFYTDPGAGRELSVTYSIDGTSAAQVMQPLTWGSNRLQFAGVYDGGLVMLTKTPFGTCPPLSFGFNDASREVRLGVQLDYQGHDVWIGWGTGIDTACTIAGTYTQRGHLGSLSGHLNCGPIGFDPDAGAPIELTELAIGPHGFSGAAAWQRSDGCSYTGHFGGVRVD